MKHIDEETLETFVLSPNALSPPVKRGIEEHLASCSGCKLLLGTLRGLHDDLSSIQSIASPAVDRFLQNLDPLAQIIHMKAYKPLPDVSASLPPIEIQAAMTDLPPTLTEFETVATLASELEHLLLRVQVDRSTGTVRAHLHAEDPRKREGAIVAFPALGMEVIVDEQGKVAFEILPQIRAKEWSTIEAMVLLPVAEVELQVPPAGYPPVKTNMDGRSGSYAVNLTRDGELLKLSITLIGGALPISRAVAITGEGTRLLADLSGGYCSFKADKIGPTLRVYFYA